jgi:hypothetical protein
MFGGMLAHSIEHALIPRVTSRRFCWIPAQDASGISDNHGPQELRYYLSMLLAYSMELHILQHRPDTTR